MIFYSHNKEKISQIKSTMQIKKIKIFKDQEKKSNGNSSGEEYIFNSGHIK